MALLEADGDGSLDRFVDDVEIVRSGYTLARDPKAYRRWRRDVERRSGRVHGKDLAQLAKAFGQVGGGQVVRGEFEFRN